MSLFNQPRHRAEQKSKEILVNYYLAVDYTGGGGGSGDGGGVHCIVLNSFYYSFNFLSHTFGRVIIIFLFIYVKNS